MNRVIPIIFALGLFGCGSAPKEIPGQPKPAAIVEMHFHSFEPKSVIVNAGEAVLWRNTTPLVWHTATFDPGMAEKSENVQLPAGAKPFDSGKVASGGTYEHVFTTPGTYKYVCQPHEAKGMVGEITVK